MTLSLSVDGLPVNTTVHAHYRTPDELLVELPDPELERLLSVFAVTRLADGHYLFDAADMPVLDEALPPVRRRALSSPAGHG